MAERESIESIGESLLSQQRERREKADKRRRRDRQKLMVLGTLVAGQSLVNSALKRRMTEIKDNNELNMINSKLYHKKIQTAAQLYEPFEQYKITDFDSAYGNEQFQNDFDKIYSPIYERQLKAEGGDKVLSAGDKIRHYELYKADQIKNLLSNQEAWNSGISDFGVTNKQLGLGSEADLNVQLTRKSKELQRNMGGSVFDFNNLRALLTVGSKRKGSVWDQNLSEVNPLQGLQQTVTNLGLDKKFQESYTNFRNTSMRWDDKGDEATQTSMINSLQDLEARLRKGDVLLQRQQTLRPFAAQDLPSYMKHREKIAGGVRMGEFNAYLNDPNNGFFKEQFLRNSTGLYLKLRDERGFKEEFLKDILKLDPASEEYRQMERNLNDDITLRLFSNSYTIQQLVTDRSGDNKIAPFFGEEFTIDTRPFDKLLRPKIEISSKGYKVTEEFSKATDEEQIQAVVDEVNRIVKTPLDPTKKSELINSLYDQVPLSVSKEEMRELVANQALLGSNQVQATRMSTTRIEQLKEDIKNKVVTTVDFTGKRQTRPASPRDISNMESQIRRFSEFNIRRLQDPVQGRELRSQMDRLDIEIQSLENRLPTLKQNLPQNRYDAQLEKLEDLKEERQELEEQLTNPQAEDQKKNLVELDPSINLESINPVIEWSFSSGRLNQPLEKSNIITNKLLQAIIEVESDFNYDAINPTANSTAVGAGQFLKDSLVTAVNRANNIREKNNLPPLPQTQAIKDNDARINTLIAEERSRLEARQTPEETIKAELQKIAKREFQNKNSIARQLSPEVQQELILANLFEADGSDVLFKRLLNATTPQEQYEAALDLYLEKHHTDRTDKATVERARKIFKPYFLN